LVIALAAGIVYGIVIFGIFPSDPLVSWETNIFGLLAGILISIFYYKIFQQYLNKNRNFKELDEDHVPIDVENQKDAKQPQQQAPTKQVTPQSTLRTKTVEKNPFDQDKTQQVSTSQPKDSPNLSASQSGSLRTTHRATTTTETNPWNQTSNVQGNTKASGEPTAEDFSSTQQTQNPFDDH